jgi:hypothetical protein
MASFDIKPSPPPSEALPDHLLKGLRALWVCRVGAHAHATGPGPQLGPTDGVLPTANWKDRFPAAGPSLRVLVMVTGAQF